MTRAAAASRRRPLHETSLTARLITAADAAAAAGAAPASMSTGKKGMSRLCQCPARLLFCFYTLPEVTYRVSK